MKHWFKWVRTGIGAWMNKKVIECIKKHLHPSANEECRCLYVEAINYLVIINSFLSPSASYFCTCDAS